jgi:heme exporter protein A
VQSNDNRQVTLSVDGVVHRYGARPVLSNIVFDCKSGDSLCITGHNGSGKSTLLKIIAGLLRPIGGAIRLSISGHAVDPDSRRKHIRLVSTEAELYDDLTGLENLEFLTRVAGQKLSRVQIEAFLDRVGLHNRGNDRYGAYSSGMKQRLKLAAAIITSPRLLLLDEPTSNLDDDGRKIVYEIIDEQKSNGILIFATNDNDEVKLGGRVVTLG